ncbi:hypothetical protein C5167_044046 [Papaver somniferum]|uniref:Uncharacterized protein n=1 Tax=Papaver somniferum TaxID=3469 RepID=A0A4Y7L9Z8_PAPSO|nr:uncharacterized protein LOC113318984 isoform X2 [Papaver somniferum]RZC81470.1 hypothetical protein C5167_044046 [Papaver somniferum]
MDKRNKIKPIETKEYPKVKVRSEDDDFCSHKEKNCLMLLKVFETLSLQVQASPGKELENDIPPSVARVPKLYSPVLAVPSTSSAKGAQKHEKQIEEDTKSNNGASSVLRPRAVLSSPYNDGMIGHINRLSRVELANGRAGAGLLRVTRVRVNTDQNPRVDILHGWSFLQPAPVTG